MDLGLSEYEAKAYLALLAHNPATAYETAKASGIPTSKIYEVMEKMRARGLVLQAEENEDRKRYLPQDPREFLAGQRSRLTDTISGLDEELKAYSSALDASYLWNIRDRAALIDKARTTISQAGSELLISACNEELQELSRALEECSQRGVRMATVYFGEQRMSLPGRVYPHPIADTLQQEKGGRGFALVADSSEALIGTIAPDGRTEGAYSRNRGFVVLAEDYIKHDVYIMKIVSRYDGELIRRFGERYALLRDVFADNEQDD
jgi:sugar-specific transcriptional regulator TrmB